MAGKKIYFISDAHLGVDSRLTSDQRELLLIKWLSEIQNDAKEINFLGDIFDFWFEFKYIVPRGFARLFSKMRELSDLGIKLNYYTGNHDMWIFDYIPKITGASLIRGTQIVEYSGKRFFIGHGDGLDSSDKKYLFLKKVFSAKFFQFCFRLIHPEITFRIAFAWSKASRKSHNCTEKTSYEDEKLVAFAKSVLAKDRIDFFVFGHRHIPFQIKIDEAVLFTNIGDWLNNFTYAEFDGENVSIHKYPI